MKIIILPSWYFCCFLFISLSKLVHFICLWDHTSNEGKKCCIPLFSILFLLCISSSTHLDSVLFPVGLQESSVSCSSRCTTFLLPRLCIITVAKNKYYQLPTEVFPAAQHPHQHKRIVPEIRIFTEKKLRRKSQEDAKKDTAGRELMLLTASGAWRHSGIIYTVASITEVWRLCSCTADLRSHLVFFNHGDVWILSASLQHLKSFIFQPFCFRFAAVFGIIVLLHDVVSAKL